VGSAEGSSSDLDYKRGLQAGGSYSATQRLTLARNTWYGPLKTYVKLKLGVAGGEGNGDDGAVSIRLGKKGKMAIL